MTDKQHADALRQHRDALAAKFAQVMADFRREEEREIASQSILVECGYCYGTGEGRLFSSCLNCRGNGVVLEDE